MQQSVGAPTNYTYTKDIARFQSFYSKINEREELWETEPGYCKHIFLVAPFKIQCVQGTNDL